MAFTPSYMQGRGRRITAAGEMSMREGMRSHAPSMAQSLHTMSFKGHGDIVWDEFRFDLAFLGEPAFTSGMVIVKGPDTAQWRMPLATAYVMYWLADGDDIYHGARVGASVSMLPAINPETGPVTPTAPAVADLRFHLVFTGRASRSGEIGMAR